MALRTFGEREGVASSKVHFGTVVLEAGSALAVGEGQTRLWGQPESTGPGLGLFPTYDLSIELAPNRSFTTCCLG